MAVDRERITNEIAQGLDALTLRQLLIVAAMVEHLHVPVNYIPGAGSDIVDDKFAEEMANLLSLHHSTHEAPLNKKPFEYAFKQCLIAQGYAESDLNPQPGESAYDVFGHGVRWSLKTEAGKGFSGGVVRIEKLSEARWIREATTSEAAATEVRERLPHHMSGYDRILVLRAETRPDSFVYTLVEVPKSLLLESFSSATPSMFAKTDRGAKKGISFGADFRHPFNHDVIFRMLLDSSVEKVRVWFRLKYCVHHGTWIVRRPTREAPDLYTSTS